jgi:hypothetical protein
VGDFTGELQRGLLVNVQNTVLINPDYTGAIARIISAVAPYRHVRQSRQHKAPPARIRTAQKCGAVLARSSWAASGS